MDVQTLSSVAGAVLSLIFSYIPGAKQWYGALDGTYKRLVMALLLALTAAVVYALSCTGWAHEFGLVVTCDRQGLAALLRAFLSALVANQATYLISPKGLEG